MHCSHSLAKQNYPTNSPANELSTHRSTITLTSSFLSNQLDNAPQRDSLQSQLIFTRLYFQYYNHIYIHTKKTDCIISRFCFVEDSFIEVFIKAFISVRLISASVVGVPPVRHSRLPRIAYHLYKSTWRLPFLFYRLFLDSSSILLKRHFDIRM